MRRDRLTLPVRWEELFTFVTVDLPITLPDLKRTLLGALIRVWQEQDGPGGFPQSSHDLHLRVLWHRGLENVFPERMMISDENIASLLSFLNENKGYYVVDGGLR